MFHEFIKKPKKEKGEKRKRPVVEQVKDEVVNVEDDRELLNNKVTVKKERKTDSKINKFKRKQPTK